MARESFAEVAASVEMARRSPRAARAEANTRLTVTSLMGQSTMAACGAAPGNLSHEP